MQFVEKAQKMSVFYQNNLDAGETAYVLTNAGYFNMSTGIQEADADIFCIQESKMQEGQLELELPGYHQYWNYAVKKGLIAQKGF